MVSNVATTGWGSVLVSSPVMKMIEDDPALLADFKVRSIAQWDYDGIFILRVESRLIPVDGCHYDVGIDNGKLVFRRSDEFVPEFHVPE